MFRFLPLWIFPFFLSIIPVSLVRANGIIIVTNHQPKAVIVIPEAASQQIQYAAIILQDYIKKSTGALIHITSHAQNNTVTVVNLGLTEYVKNQNIKIKDLDEDGFILQGVDAHNFIIVGGSDWGTEFGVYSFLERYLGVEDLMPTNLGINIPLHTSLILPEVRIIDNPVYISREISPIYIVVGSHLGNWGRFNKLKGRIFFSHNLLNLFPIKQYLKTNPEFYPMVNGKRIIPLDSLDFRWQPNFSAKGIVDSASKKIIKYFDDHPSATTFSLGINDSQIFDESPQSLIRRNGKKNYFGVEDISNDYFKWANEVVKKVALKYPDKKFGLLAYRNIAEPPSINISVAPQMIPFLTYQRWRWSNPILKEQGYKINEEWTKMCAVIGWYDYIYGYNLLVPGIWFHEMQQYLKWGMHHHVKYYYGELYPNWGEGPKPWITSKLLWNPNQNVDSLLNVWYVSFAGPRAALKLQQFYKIWENYWTKDNLNYKWNKSDGPYVSTPNLAYLNTVPQRYVDICDSLMEAAYNLTDTEIQKERVLELKKMWRVYKTAIELYKKNKLPEELKKKRLISSPEFRSLLSNLKNDSIHSQTISNIEGTFDIK